MRIYKYPLNNGTTYIPLDGQVLCIELQNNIPCAWVLHNNYNFGTRALFIVGTGQEFYGNYIYHKTLFDSDGFVWHVFEGY